MDNFNLSGSIYVCISDKENNIIKEEKITNLVTDNGLKIFVRCIAGEIEGIANRLVIGLSNTPETKEDDALGEKLLHGEIEAEYLDNTITFFRRFNAGSVNTNYWIKEIGLAYFDGVNEILVTRATFDSDREVFITPNNNLSLKYQISVINE